MTALDETPQPMALWCAATPPFTSYVLCKRLAGHSGLHRSDGGDDWAETVRVSPPTTSNEETRNG
jgi:hypothetical protein